MHRLSISIPHWLKFSHKIIFINIKILRWSEIYNYTNNIPCKIFRFSVRSYIYLREWGRNGTHRIIIFSQYNNIMYISTI